MSSRLKNAALWAFIGAFIALAALLVADALQYPAN